MPRMQAAGFPQESSLNLSSCVLARERSRVQGYLAAPESVHLGNAAAPFFVASAALRVESRASENTSLS